VTAVVSMNTPNTVELLDGRNSGGTSTDKQPADADPIDGDSARRAEAAGGATVASLNIPQAIGAGPIDMEGLTNGLIRSGRAANAEAARGIPMRGGDRPERGAVPATQAAGDGTSTFSMPNADNGGPVADANAGGGNPSGQGASGGDRPGRAPNGPPISGPVAAPIPGGHANPPSALPPANANSGPVGGVPGPVAELRHNGNGGSGMPALVGPGASAPQPNSNGPSGGWVAGPVTELPSNGNSSGGGALINIPGGSNGGSQGPSGNGPLGLADNGGTPPGWARGSGPKVK
jgi:hypothetical protein